MLCVSQGVIVYMLYVLLDEDGTAKMRLIYSKEAKEYRLKNVYDRKSYDFRQEILRNIIKEATKPTPHMPGVRHIVFQSCVIQWYELFSST